MRLAANTHPRERQTSWPADCAAGRDVSPKSPICARRAPPSSLLRHAEGRRPSRWNDRAAGLDGRRRRAHDRRVPGVFTRVVGTLVLVGSLTAPSAAMAGPPERGAASSTATMGSRHDCDGRWHHLSSRNPKHDYLDFDSLTSISASSSSDAWAIGILDDFDQPPYGFRTLAEHWDGTRWSHVRMPNSRKTTWDELHGVAAIAPDDAWAVGVEGTSPYGSLIEHWNGSAWTIQDDGTPESYLTSVSALGPNDVWVAGSTNYVGDGLILHWDGSTWTRTELPDPIVFRAIDALAPDDVWAVGQYAVNGSGDLTAAYHFDGLAWTRFTTPNPLQQHDIDQNWLTSITAVAPDDVWATGISRDVDYGVLDAPFTIHWNGSKWRLVATPNPGGQGDYTGLWGAVAFGSNNVWAVGRVGSDPDWTTFTIRWDGSSWTPVPSSTPGEFLAAADDHAGGLLAVGDLDSPHYTGIATLVERLCPAP
jgi:hypothetical protein